MEQSSQSWPEGHREAILSVARESYDANQKHRTTRSEAMERLIAIEDPELAIKAFIALQLVDPLYGLITTAQFDRLVEKCGHIMRNFPLMDQLKTDIGKLLDCAGLRHAG